MNIHFNGYKARYQFLNYHMAPVLRSHNVKAINIFLNLDDLFHTLHRPLINNEFQVSGMNAHVELVSNIFNLIGHYRHWAMKNHINPKIFLIYTSATHSFKNNMWVADYRKKFFEINDQNNSNYYFINNALRYSYPIMHTISRYLAGIYTIDSKYLEPSMVPLFLSAEKPADWNILISRDTYDVQYCYKDKWTVVSPKGDNSTCINRENMWNYLNYRERIYKEPVDLHYHHGLYLLSKAIVGDSYRNIKRLRRVGWITLFKYLNQLEEAKTESTDNILIQEHCFTELARANKLDPKVFNKNLYAIDTEIQVKNMLDLDKSIITSQLIDMEDYRSLTELNRTTFHLYPINLDYLCSTLVPFGIWQKPERPYI